MPAARPLQASGSANSSAATAVPDAKALWASGSANSGALTVYDSSGRDCTRGPARPVVPDGNGVTGAVRSSTHLECYFDDQTPGME